MQYKFDPGNPDYLVMIGEQNRRTLALNARELSRKPQVTCFLFERAAGPTQSLMSCSHPQRRRTASHNVTSAMGICG